MTHAVLADSPIWQAYEAEVAAVKARFDVVMSAMTEAGEQQAQQDRETEALAAEARANGDAIPVPPPPVARDHLVVEHSHAVRAQQQVLAKKRRVMADVAAAGAIDHLRDRERVRLEEARATLLPLVEAMLAEATADGRLMRELLAAEDRDTRSIPSRASRVPNPDVAMLLWAAEHGASLLDPDPLVKVDTSGPRITRDDDGSYRKAILGLQPGSTVARADGLPTA